MWNANSLVQDLNSCHRFNFKRWWQLLFRHPLLDFTVPYWCSVQTHPSNHILPRQIYSLTWIISYLDWPFKTNKIRQSHKYSFCYSFKVAFYLFDCYRFFFNGGGSGDWNKQRKKKKRRNERKREKSKLKGNWESNGSREQMKLVKIKKNRKGLNLRQ